MLYMAHKNKDFHTKGGFALVISLSLMAFVLVLILSITTLVQVESSSAQISQKRLEAELNAYLGLQIALGELQKTLGPDQRVSATADLFAATNPARGNTVGVWASADAPSLSLTEGDLITWLASDAGGSSSGFQTDYVIQPQPSSGTNIITLVGAGSVTDLDEDGVADDLNEQVVIDIANTEVDRGGSVVGQYAWWVSDEGTKARINLDRAEEQVGASKQLSVLEAGSSSVANAAALDGLALVKFGEETDRLTELNNLELVSGETTPFSKNYFYDLTTWSNGVLADAKNGGLKKDLSLAFEMDDSRFNASAFAAGGLATINAEGFGRVQPIFSLANSTGSPAYGPVWHLLRDYYRIYHLMEDPMGNPTLDARVFGPNVNHGEATLALGSELTNSPAALDKQPAILFAGGKAKFFNQSYESFGSYGPMTGGPLAFASFREQHPNNNEAALDFAMRDADPLRLGTTGDPLRGGGTSVSGTIMPVMVTGNYMPYLIRFVAEMGIWFSPYVGTTVTTPANLVHLNEATRETFVLHNPYNVTIRHDEIGIDSFGFDIQYSLENLDGSRYELYKTNGTRGDNTEQLESERQARIPRDSFEPGEIKAYDAKNYGQNSSDTVDYTQEGTNPEWHHYKFDNNNPGSWLFERPTLAYTLNANGGTMHHAQTHQPYHQTDDYSATSIFMATYLKQTGNSDFDGIYLRDRWPLASVFDTALLLPGSEYDNSNPTKPGSFSRLFPDSIDITSNLIDIHSSRENSLPTATFDFQLKPAEYGKLNVRYPAFARSNPLAPVRDNKNLLPADDFIENSVGFPKLSPDTDLGIFTGVSGLFKSKYDWGPTDGEIPGVDNPVMIELPTSPVLSLGKLQHANISIHAHMPALAIGNSLASVYIPKDQVFTTFENYYEQERIFYDLSYLMNDALWDSYYFSSYSLPYNAGADDYDESGSSVLEMFDTFAAGTESLPNSRMSLHSSASESTQDLRTKLFDGSTIKIDAPDRAAENLLVKGSFNINSSSVAAWRAVLSGARDYAIYPSGDNAAVLPTVGNTPMSRFTQPVGGESPGSADDVWAGFRSLSDMEIESLATEIVVEIRRRVSTTNRPYLSLSDFVNRELTNSDSGRTGVIQAAIDRVGLNGDISPSFAAISEGSLNDGGNGIFPNPENILLADGSNGSGSMSAPTYLMQADVLQAIGSFISVRSDTFRIRSYGQSLESINGEVLSKVWYEAIVQRVPEPVNPGATSPEDSDYWTALDSSGEPQPFGRRFTVLSIRQLSEDDV